MKLYNSLSRSIETFTPIDPSQVTLYTCGPTVYNYAHIGNLRTYIHEDILEKALTAHGYRVKRVMNITDVGHLESDADEGDDKMLKGAIRENKTVWEVAEQYTEAFFDDCKKLNIAKPGIVAKATDQIADYIAFIQVLEAKGFTYFVNGNVYFDISKCEDYTQLSKMNLDDLKVALRDDVEEDTFKKNPQDFVLWFTKSKFENQAMKWESPWGVGYPGWHIECSVIALKFLGEQIDIHCGGVDHILVHHTNEIAQTESYTGKKWVNYWWHSEFLQLNSGKMSKSKGEFLTVSVLQQKGHNPLAYRYYVLNSHYRKQLPFTFDSLAMAETAFNKMKKRCMVYKDVEVEVLSDAAKAYQQSFLDALGDDLNTANAVTVLFDVLKATDISASDKRQLIESFDLVLSFDLMVEVINVIDVDLSAQVEALILDRANAKAQKDWGKADAIRDAINALGVAIKDTPQGTTWTKE
jgi:cysteinyl-tRNA synthetase